MQFAGARHCTVARDKLHENSICYLLEWNLNGESLHHFYHNFFSFYDKEKTLKFIQKKKKLQRNSLNSLPNCLGAVFVLFLYRLNRKNRISFFFFFYFSLLKRSRSIYQRVFCNMSCIVNDVQGTELFRQLYYSRV